MLPHIVFSEGGGYFPGPQRWGAAELNSDAPDAPRTSGICQPPVHAIALRRIVDIGRGDRCGGAAAARGLAAPVPLARVAGAPPRPARHRHAGDRARLGVRNGQLAALGRALRRGDARTGPAAVRPARPRPGRARRRRAAERPRVRPVPVADRGDAQGPLRRRPGGAHVELPRRGRVRDRALRARERGARRRWARRAGSRRGRSGSCVAGPAARGPRSPTRTTRSPGSRATATCAPGRGCRAGPSRASRRCCAAAWRTRTSSGCWRRSRVRTGRVTRSSSRPSRRRSPRRTRASGPASTGAVRCGRCWRGCSAWAFERRGWAAPAKRLRAECLRLVEDGTFAEYYHPLTGEPLGSRQQSWTATVVLDWLHTT